MKRALVIGAIVIVIGAAIAFWYAQRPSVAGKIVLGPYPAEADIVRLKQGGVTALVSLLDPALPYEAALLAREKRAAANAGMEFVSFPMTSILVRRDDPRNPAAAQQAADYARRAPGKVYVHCYLGIHRVRAVADRLQLVETPVPSEEDRRQLLVAQRFLEAKQYGAVLDALDKIRKPTAQAQAMRGWASLGLGLLDDAAAAFRAAAFANPNDAKALTGLGYAYLRKNELDAAREAFSRAVLFDPANAEAREMLKGL